MPLPPRSPRGAATSATRALSSWPEAPRSAPSEALVYGSALGDYDGRDPGSGDLPRSQPGRIATP